VPNKFKKPVKKYIIQAAGLTLVLDCSARWVFNISYGQPVAQSQGTIGKGNAFTIFT